MLPNRATVDRADRQWMRGRHPARCSGRCKPSVARRQYADLGPHGELGVEQSDKPVGPITVGKPLAGLIDARLASKPSASKDPFDVGTRPLKSWSAALRIWWKAPVPRSTVPNCWLPVIKLKGVTY